MSKEIELLNVGVPIQPRSCPCCMHPNHPIGHEVRLRTMGTMDEFWVDELCLDCADRLQWQIRKLLAKSFPQGKLIDDLRPRNV